MKNPGFRKCIVVYCSKVLPYCLSCFNLLVNTGTIVNYLIVHSSIALLLLIFSPGL